MMAALRFKDVFKSLNVAFSIEESDLDDGKENYYDTNTKGIITKSGREILKASEQNNHDEDIDMVVQKTIEKPEYK